MQYVKILVLVSMSYKGSCFERLRRITIVKFLLKFLFDNGVGWSILFHLVRVRPYNLSFVPYKDRGNFCMVQIISVKISLNKDTLF